MSEQEAITDAVEIERQLLGASLKQAREAQGLSLSEVSGALKFSIRQIEALESDKHDQLQGKTFLRGFIRSYARLLKLQPEALLAMLDVESIPPAEQIVPPENMGETDPLPIYRRHGKTILSVVLAVLVAIGLAWQYSQEPKDVIKVAAPTQPAVSLQPIIEPVPQLVADPHGAEQPGPVIAAATNAQAVSDQAAVKPVTTGELVFEFSDLSWLEVKDASGQILLTGQFPAGQKQMTKGKPPYQLWIGKASAVKVTYKDQMVNLQSYSLGNVARLTLE